MKKTKISIDGTVYELMYRIHENFSDVHYVDFYYGYVITRYINPLFWQKEKYIERVKPCYVFSIYADAYDVTVSKEEWQNRICEKFKNHIEKQNNVKIRRTEIENGDFF